MVIRGLRTPKRWPDAAGSSLSYTRLSLAVSYGNSYGEGKLGASQNETLCAAPPQLLNLLQHVFLAICLKDAHIELALNDIVSFSDGCVSNSHF
jgi:hypothetical protein